jgi:hypothetical protein
MSDPGVRGEGSGACLPERLSAEQVLWQAGQCRQGQVRLARRNESAVGLRPVSPRFDNAKSFGLSKFTSCFRLLSGGSLLPHVRHPIHHECYRR